jgi:two-component system KDP operon response regulator KdpE
VSLGRILIVDDDPQIRRVLKIALTGEGYEVKDVRSGEDAELALRESRYDLMLLDMNMPGMGGFETCRRVRSTSDIAIIMLTVRNTEEDKIAALDAGADDFVTKPFSTPELLARIRAALRRAPMAPEAGAQRVELGDTVIDFEGRRVTASGKNMRDKTVRLTPKEFDLLRYLTLHPNRAIPHRELLQAVWGPDYGDETEYLRVFIKQLRKKIESDPANPKFLLTEPWVGYRLQLSQAT